jgi:AcrR family transcriptional regulator
MWTLTTLTSMAREVDTVNIPFRSSSDRPYHHGQLRAATRAAGVSHNAAYRHFADRDELLRAVCERCMSRLATLMQRRISESPSPTR